MVREHLILHPCSQTVETWIAFITTDEKSVSDSLFTGEITLKTKKEDGWQPSKSCQLLNRFY
jgi:hypothetical protein